MISVSHLSKKYPGRLAVNDISFEVDNREVVGFLGPNGSGKSTTMRMLCGYLAPSGGTARVAGYDVTKNPMEVRRRIGYMPENCPLYPELRIDEYLSFRAALKGVTRARRTARIAEVKELCGLADAGRRIIGQLSRGYRQRVGLAEALVHDPEILILDEPTAGLDPGQIRQVRELIRQLGERHTILLSTHILSEVEAVCRRVVIIHEGRIAASDKTDTLIRQRQGAVSLVAEVKAPRLALEQALAGWADISDVTICTEGDWQYVSFTAAPEPDIRPRFSSLAAGQGWPLRELHRRRSRLEDLFISLTTASTNENQSS